MLNLIWGILNAAIFLYFLFILFKAIALVRNNIGLFAAIVLIIGSVTFFRVSLPDQVDKKEWVLNPIDSLDQNQADKQFMGFEVENNLVSKNILFLEYVRFKEGKKYIPLKASATTNGFISGVKWLPLSIIINETQQKNQFEYIIDGETKWSLLGINVFSRSKSYKGLISLR